MPHPSAAPAGPRLTRRAALTGAAAVAGAALTGCTVDNPFSGSGSPTAGPSSTGSVDVPADPDVTAAGEALRAEEETMALLRATAQRHPRLAARLEAPLAAHEAHVALLDEAAPEPPSPSSSGPAAPGTSATPSPGSAHGRRTPVPRNRSRALRAVVDAETALSSTLREHALAAESGSFARVLGSMAASAAQHAAVLARGVRG